MPAQYPTVYDNVIDSLKKIVNNTALIAGESVNGDQTQIITLNSGNVSKAVTFTGYGTAVTSIAVQIIGPSGGFVITCEPTNVTKAGCTVVFGASIPSAGYTLSVRTTGS